MILYFSATGNSEHVARQIAGKTGDELVDIAQLAREQHPSVTLAEGESLGIVTPVYYWILPSLVEELLSSLEIHAHGNSHYTFLVVTYGTTPGAALTLASRYMKEKGFPFAALYTVQMPDTWTPTFDLSDPSKVKALNEKADDQIRVVANRILKKKIGDFSRRKLPRCVIGAARTSYERARQTSHLHVTDDCIGCSLCAKNCPVGAIEMQGSRPVWIKDKCMMCLRCLHRCPKFAIQYDNRTQKHGQYVHP